MNQTLQVLAIDDHAVVLEGYNYMFQNLRHNHNGILFSKAQDCKSGYKVISANKDTPFDIAVLDYSIPHYEDKKLYSGADLAVIIRQTMPACKIIMMTMHKETAIMGGILSTINPEGFINKSDCTTDELVVAFEEVIKGNAFYSKTVLDYMKRKESGIVLEDIDVRIILLLAKGIKNKNLSTYIPLSDSAIEKRKYKIKRMLEVEGNDDDLILEAKTQGFI